MTPAATNAYAPPGQIEYTTSQQGAISISICVSNNRLTDIVFSSNYRRIQELLTQHSVMLAVYYVLLLLGLSTMLIDGLGMVSLGVYFVAMPVGAYVVGRSGGLRWRDRLPPDVAAPRDMLRSVLGAVIAFGLVMGVFVVMQIAGWSKLAPVSWNVVSLLVGLLAQQAVVASIEEFTFRGVLQSLLIKRWGTSAGLAIAAFLFGLFHLPNILYQDVSSVGIPLTLLNLTLMGLVFGAAYVWSGSLYLPIALHFGWNVASFGVEWFYEMVLTGPELLTGQSAWFPESGLLGTCGLLLLGAAVHRIDQRDTRRR